MNDIGLRVLLVVLAAVFVLGIVVCLLAIVENLRHPETREPVTLAVGCFEAVLLSVGLWVTWLTWAALGVKRG